MQMILIRSERSSDTEVTSGRDFMDAGRDPDIVYNSKKTAEFREHGAAAVEGREG